ncbi:MAG: dockerin type I domain-containing protein, partial [Phycisphaerales bacterium]|nr:dockerin type I domain-containing protein [Phycisphaerales bacterium]
DIAPPPTGDGQVNVSDLLTLISYWGKCAEGEPCPADIAPFGGDGSVNVSDLLMVIELWGPCF